MSAQSEAAHRFTPYDFFLYGMTVFAWSTSWIALKMQVGVVAPEVSITWRFLLAALVMVVWQGLAGRPMRFPLKDHLRFAAQGLTTFSLNFFCFYMGGLHLASGLLSVVFSLASVTNIIMAAIVFRQKVDPRVAVGATIGFIGIGLIFWPEIAGTEFDHNALIGLLFCLGGVTLFSIGNMLSTSNQRRGLPVFSINAWGMIYATLIMAALSLAGGREFTVEWTLPYLGALVWLAVVSSVIAFACYLTLLGRIGASRAGYATVVFPVFALAISTVFENYHWTALAGAGLVAVMAGNLIVLTRGK